jgi:hypothetical protein
LLRPPGKKRQHTMDRANAPTYLIVDGIGGSFMQHPLGFGYLVNAEEKIQRPHHSQP